MRHALISLLLLFLLSAAASGQGAAQLSGPALGFVFDPGQAAVLPLRGIAGAAAAGAPIELGGRAAFAAASGTGQYSLAVMARGGQVKLVRPGGITPLNVAPFPDSLIISPGGNVAALFWKDSAALQLVGGLPAVPRVQAVVNVTLPGTVRLLAVSDDARTALFGAGAEGAQSVYAVSAEETRALLHPGTVAAAAFLSGGTDVVVADGAGAVSLVKSQGVISLGAEKIGPAVAVAASRDNRHVAVAYASGEIALLAVNGGGAARLSCACSPVALERMNGNAVFRLTGPPNRVLLLDGDATAPRVVFVPLEQSSSGSRRERMPETEPRR